MRLFLWLLSLIFIAIVLAIAARFNQGNVVLFYPPYRVDLSLNFFLLAAGLLFVVLYLVLRTIDLTQKLPKRVAEYRKGKREREDNRALRESLKALFEGRFGHAEKAATRAASSSENAGLAALIGARAAHRMRQSERRDAWLTKVEADASLRTARLITTIELLVDDRQPDAALDAVKELNASGTRHIHALRWALKANQQAENWSEVLRLVRSLDKHDALHPALSSRLLELAYQNLLCSKTHDAESIRLLWLSIPMSDRVKPFIAAHAANAFTAHGLQDVARTIIERALAEEWDVRLLRAYRESAAEEGSSALLAQIDHCERWALERPTDAELSVTLSTLCFKQKLWGKVQHHLEQALSDATESRTVREANLKLAQLHETLDHPEQAARYYRQCALATML